MTQDPAKSNDPVERLRQAVAEAGSEVLGTSNSGGQLIIRLAYKDDVDPKPLLDFATSIRGRVQMSPGEIQLSLAAETVAPKVASVADGSLKPVKTRDKGSAVSNVGGSRTFGGYDSFAILASAGDAPFPVKTPILAREVIKWIRDNPDKKRPMFMIAVQTKSAAPFDPGQIIPEVALAKWAAENPGVRPPGVTILVISRFESKLTSSNIRLDSESLEQLGTSLPVEPIGDPTEGYDKVEEFIHTQATRRSQ